MSDSKNSSRGWAASNIRNSVRLRYWTGAWVLSLALAVFGPKFIWDYQTGISIMGVVANLAIGYGMIVANKRYVQGQDEMHRKIFLDAGALALGVGVVCGLSYEMLEDIKLITFQPEISHLILLICLAFIVGMVMGHRNYR